MPVYRNRVWTRRAREAINAAKMVGQRSSSSELPTADLSASAACHQLLLPSDAMDVPEVLELLEQGRRRTLSSTSSVCTLLPVRESFETLDQCAFAALIATLNAETSLPKGKTWTAPWIDSQSRGAQDGGLLVTNSSLDRTLRVRRLPRTTPDELDRML